MARTVPGPLLSDGPSSVSSGQPHSPASPHPPLPSGVMSGPGERALTQSCLLLQPALDSHSQPMPRPHWMSWFQSGVPRGGLTLCSPFDLSPSHQSPGCPGPAVSRVPLLPLHLHAPWSTLGGGQGLSHLAASRPAHNLASLELEVFAQALCVCTPLTTAPHSPLDSGLLAAVLEGAPGAHAETHLPSLSCWVYSLPPVVAPSP